MADSADARSSPPARPWLASSRPMPACAVVAAVRARTEIAITRSKKAEHDLDYKPVRITRLPRPKRSTRRAVRPPDPQGAANGRTAMPAPGRQPASGAPPGDRQQAGERTQPHPSSPRECLRSPGRRTCWVTALARTDHPARDSLLAWPSKADDREDGNGRRVPARAPAKAIADGLRPACPGNFAPVCPLSSAPIGRRPFPPGLASSVGHRLRSDDRSLPASARASTACATSASLIREGRAPWRIRPALCEPNSPTMISLPAKPAATWRVIATTWSAASRAGIGFVLPDTQEMDGHRSDR